MSNVRAEVAKQFKKRKDYIDLLKSKNITEQDLESWVDDVDTHQKEILELLAVDVKNCGEAREEITKEAKKCLDRLKGHEDKCFYEILQRRAVGNTDNSDDSILIDRIIEDVELDCGAKLLVPSIGDLEGREINEEQFQNIVEFIELLLLLVVDPEHVYLVKINDPEVVQIPGAGRRYTPWLMLLVSNSSMRKAPRSFSRGTFMRGKNQIDISLPVTAGDGNKEGDGQKERTDKILAEIASQIHVPYKRENDVLQSEDFDKLDSMIRNLNHGRHSYFVVAAHNVHLTSLKKIKNKFKSLRISRLSNSKQTSLLRFDEIDVESLIDNLLLLLEELKEFNDTRKTRAS